MPIQTLTAALVFSLVMGFTPGPNNIMLAASGAQAIVILSGGFQDNAPEYGAGGGAVDSLTLQRLRYGAHLAHRLPRRVLEIAFGAFLLAVSLRFLVSLI